MRLVFGFIFLVALTLNAKANNHPITSVRHPIAIDDSQSTLIAVINKSLPADRQFLEYFEVSEIETPYQAQVRWAVLKAEFTETVELYAPAYNGNEIQLGIIPTAVDSGAVKTCYVGNPQVAKNLALTLVGNEFTEQLIIWAYRIGHDTWIQSGLQNDVTNAHFNTYQSDSANIFMLGSYSDGGDDENEIVISPCF